MADVVFALNQNAICLLFKFVCTSFCPWTPRQRLEPAGGASGERQCHAKSAPRWGGHQGYPEEVPINVLREKMPCAGLLESGWMNSWPEAQILGDHDFPPVTNLL